MLFSIAWKNIWRNKLRSLIVITAVTLGMIGGIISGGVLIGAADQSLADAADNYASEIQIRHPEYIINNDLKYYIKNSSVTTEFIKNIPGVKSAVSRIKVLGMINSPSNSIGIYINAIDPVAEKTVTSIYQRIPDTCGSYFESGKHFPIVLSQKTADKLNLKPNSKVVLSFLQLDTCYTGGAFRVSGIFKTTNSVFDGSNLFIRTSDLDKIAVFPKDIAHEIAVRVPKDEDLLRVKQTIQNAYPELSVMTWKEINPDLALYDDLMDKMIFVFLIIILLALGFGIVNTMLMAVLERIKEFGMLMAVGMSKRRVFKMIMYESIFLSSVGGVIGMIFSSILLNYWGRKGISFDSLQQGFEKFGFTSHIYPHLEPGFYFVLSFLIILTGILASVYPARKAIKLNPVEALRMDN
jgi:ABC-type lipoprotein release transport system permease subunit